MSPASGDGGPREGLRRKRSEGRLRTPLAWRRRCGPSSLWKTLRSVALQDSAQDHAKPGVSAIGGGVRGGGKGRQAIAGQEVSPVPGPHPPPGPGAGLRERASPDRLARLRPLGWVGGKGSRLSQNPLLLMPLQSGSGFGRGSLGDECAAGCASPTDTASPTFTASTSAFADPAHSPHQPTHSLNTPSPFTRLPAGPGGWPANPAGACCGRGLAPAPGGRRQAGTLGRGLRRALRAPPDPGAPPRSWWGR